MECFEQTLLKFPSRISGSHHPLRIPQGCSIEVESEAISQKSLGAELLPGLLAAHLEDGLDGSPEVMYLWPRSSMWSPKKGLQAQVI